MQKKLENDLPASVMAMAKGFDLKIENGEICHSEDQGDPLFATLCVDRWLTARSGEIRMEVRIIQRDSRSESDDWYAGYGMASDPINEAQALQLVNHWGATSKQAASLAYQAQMRERESCDESGPRPPRPWEIDLPAASAAVKKPSP